MPSMVLRRGRGAGAGRSREGLGTSSRSPARGSGNVLPPSTFQNQALLIIDEFMTGIGTQAGRGPNISPGRAPTPRALQGALLPLNIAICT